MIRAAREDDAAWIADLWNHYITETLVTFTDRPVTGDAVAARIADGPVWVTEQHTGFATYGPFRAGPGYVATVEHSIYVAPDACGDGQGAALLAAVVDHATGQGHRVMVGAISGANPGAVRFHLRHGFARVGTLPEAGRKNGEWLDLVLVQKTLAHD